LLARHLGYPGSLSATSRGKSPHTAAGKGDVSAVIEFSSSSVHESMRKNLPLRQTGSALKQDLDLPLGLGAASPGPSYVPLPCRLSGCSGWGEFMPEIMIRCPTLGTAVKTGLSTEMVVLDSLPGTVPIPMRCPACQKLHRWQRKDAWVDTANGQHHPTFSGLDIWKE
jgi:hypothetical protein